MMGNPPWASKAEEMDSPVLHAGSDVLQLGGEVGVLLLLGEHSSEPRMGRPARTRVRNCSLKMMNWLELGLLALCR